VLTGTWCYATLVILGMIVFRIRGVSVCVCRVSCMLLGRSRGSSSASLGVHMCLHGFAKFVTGDGQVIGCRRTRCVYMLHDVELGEDS
jgi:hypothetical protein